MLKNNLKSFAYTFIVSIATLIILMMTKSLYDQSEAGRAAINTVLALLATIVYFVAGLKFANLEAWYKNFLSLLLPMLAGIAVYILDMKFIQGRIDASFQNGTIYLLYNADYALIIGFLKNKFNNVDSYRKALITLAFIPTFIMWIGMQVSFAGIKKQRKRQSDAELSARIGA